ncbi:MAG: Crp/Fnr family transcriptional regulator [Chitinophagaceae bacterium]|nr:Crp/Fnr family transcriptional regulator [Chitinophagaceae bacterium]
MINETKAFFGQYIKLLPQDEAYLVELMQVKQFDKKVILTQLGDIETNVYFVFKGLLKKYFYSGKDEIVAHISREGQLLTSETSLFQNIPSKYILETIEPSILIVFSKQGLENLFSKDKRWERAGRLLISDVLVRKEYWLLNHILYTPRERFFNYVREYPDLLNRVPQKLLASHLNIKPETFSRLKQLI